MTLKLDERYEFEDDEPEYEIEVVELNSSIYKVVDFTFDSVTPIWCVLDEVSTYFEETGYAEALIQGSSTVDNDDNTYTLTVIYTI